MSFIYVELLHFYTDGWKCIKTWTVNWKKHLYIIRNEHIDGNMSIKQSLWRTAVLRGHKIWFDMEMIHFNNTDSDVVGLLFSLKYLNKCLVIKIIWCNLLITFSFICLNVMTNLFESLLRNIFHIWMFTCEWPLLNNLYSDEKTEHLLTPRLLNGCVFG